MRRVTMVLMLTGELPDDEDLKQSTMALLDSVQDAINNSDAIPTEFRVRSAMCSYAEAGPGPWGSTEHGLKVDTP